MKTHFERAGYTSETEFKVLVDRGYVKRGDVVKIMCDDDNLFLKFVTNDGRDHYFWLPGHAMIEELEAVKQGPLTIIDIAKTLEAGDLHEALSENFQELSIIDLRATVVGLSRILVEKERELKRLREDINEVRALSLSLNQVRFLP